MSGSIPNGDQFITGSGASGAGDGDDEWQQQKPRRQPGGGSPPAPGGSRAKKSTKEIVVPAGLAHGAVSWVQNKYKGSEMKAYLKGWTDNRSKRFSRILLVGDDAEKCARLLLPRVKNWSEQKQGKRKGTTGAYVAPGARVVMTLEASPSVAKYALIEAIHGSPVRFHPEKEQDKGGKTFKFSLSGGSKEQQQAVQVTATELAHQMSCYVRVPASAAGLAIQLTQRDFEEHTGCTVHFGRHRFKKGDEFHNVYVLSSDEGLVEKLHGALLHFAGEVCKKNAVFLRMYREGKFALVLEKEVLKKHRWSERYTITKPKFLPEEVAAEHHPRDGFAFVTFPDNEKGSKCLKKARDLTKRYLDKQSEEAKSGGGAAAEVPSSPPKAFVSAEDYFAAKAKSKGKTEGEDTTQEGGGAKAPPTAEVVVFRTGGMFDLLAEEAEVDPSRTEEIVVPKKKAKKSLETKDVEMCFVYASAPEMTVRESVQERREAEEKKIHDEKARKEISAKFASAAKTAAPMSATWSAMAKKAPEVKKVEQVELPAPVAFVPKQSKKVTGEEVPEEDEEEWEIAEEECLGGWYN